MGIGVAKRLALLLVVVGVSAGSMVHTAKADDGQAGGYTSFDISWPQCPSNLPDHRFEFAIIGINGGRPFTSNPCFMTQYRWAQAAQANPDVYINVDFPRQGLVEAMDGPYGKCAETDDWCRGYNWGHNLARNSIARAKAYGVTPGRYWLDVETDNYWSPSARNNSQVVRGAIDYFLDFNVPIGIYSTYYQWGLITGNYMPQAKLPIWVAGATGPEMASARCNDMRFGFAGGEIWLVQYVRQYDQNHACKPMWDSLLSNARQKNPPIFATNYQPPAPAPQPAPAPPPAPKAEQQVPATTPADAAPPPAAQVKDTASQPGFGPLTNVLNALKGSLITSK